MERCFLLRHAEAVGDEVEDPGLSARGLEQTVALASRLRSAGIDAVWHGPKRRASETGRLLADRLQVERWCTNLLDDRTPVPSAERRADYPPHRWRWLDSVPVAERDHDGAGLSAAWEELRERAGGRVVVMVSHAFVMSWFVVEVLEAPPAAWMRLPVSNAGVTELEADAGRGFVIRSFDDTSHLAKSPAVS